MALAFVMAFGVFCIKPAQVEAAQKTVEKDNTQEWLDTCNDMLKNLKKYKFRYSNSGAGSTFTKAKKGRRKCNCATYVSWCLQEFGAIKRGTTFYTSGSGSIRKSGHFGSKVKVIKKYKKPKYCKLQPGDVCCWKAHVNIYAGRSKSGKMLWYDGGKVSTASNSNGSRYTHTSAHSYGYLNGRTVSYVIRIKNL